MAFSDLKPGEKGPDGSEVVARPEINGQTFIVTKFSVSDMNGTSEDVYRVYDKDGKLDPDKTKEAAQTYAAKRVDDTLRAGRGFFNEAVGMTVDTATMVLTPGVFLANKVGLTGGALQTTLDSPGDTILGGIKSLWGTITGAKTPDGGYVKSEINTTNALSSDPSYRAGKWTAVGTSLFVGGPDSAAVRGVSWLGKFGRFFGRTAEEQTAAKAAEAAADTKAAATTAHVGPPSTPPHDAVHGAWDEMVDDAAWKKTSEWADQKRAAAAARAGQTNAASINAPTGSGIKRTIDPITRIFGKKTETVMPHDPSAVHPLDPKAPPKSASPSSDWFLGNLRNGWRARPRRLTPPDNFAGMAGYYANGAAGAIGGAIRGTIPFGRLSYWVANKFGNGVRRIAGQPVYTDRLGKSTARIASKTRNLALVGYGATHLASHFGWNFPQESLDKFDKMISDKAHEHGWVAENGYAAAKWGLNAQLWGVSKAADIAAGIGVPYAGIASTMLAGAGKNSPFSTGWFGNMFAGWNLFGGKALAATPNPATTTTPSPAKPDPQNTKPGAQTPAAPKPTAQNPDPNASDADADKRPDKTVVAPSGVTPSPAPAGATPPPNAAAEPQQTYNGKPLDGLPGDDVEGNFDPKDKSYTDAEDLNAKELNRVTRGGQQPAAQQPRRNDYRRADMTPGISTAPPVDIKPSFAANDPRNLNYNALKAPADPGRMVALSSDQAAAYGTSTMDFTKMTAAQDATWKKRNYNPSTDRSSG